VDVLTAVATKIHLERTDLRTQRVLHRASLIAGSLLLLVSAHLVSPPRGHAQDSFSESQVKAVCLFNFLKFVEWPEEAFADPLAPIVIGIAGDDPIGNSLPRVVMGKTVQRRDLVIRKYHTGEDMRTSHILYFSASEKKRIPQLLASLRGSTTLTVADVDGFLEDGGMIQLFSEGKRVRFTINVDAAFRAKLKLSSKLLSLTHVVGRNGKEGGS